MENQAKTFAIPIDQIAHLSIVVNLRAVAGASYEDEPIRRIKSVDLILNSEEGLAVQVLATQKNTEKGFHYQTKSILQQALASKNLASKRPISDEIDKRKEFLKRLLKKGSTSRKEVKNAILEYYQSQPEYGSAIR